jgi:hypothetical protein
MRPYKAIAVPPFEGGWHGLFYRDGQWHEVRDSTGNMICFNDAGAAVLAAKAAAGLRCINIEFGCVEYGLPQWSSRSTWRIPQ